MIPIRLRLDLFDLPLIVIDCISLHASGPGVDGASAVQNTLNDGIKLAGPNAEGALDKVGTGNPRNRRSQVSI